jgi:hypothetical protein
MGGGFVKSTLHQLQADLMRFALLECEVVSEENCTF